MVHDVIIVFIENHVSIWVIVGEHDIQVLSSHIDDNVRNEEMEVQLDGQ